MIVTLEKKHRTDRKELYMTVLVALKEPEKIEEQKEVMFSVKDRYESELEKLIQLQKSAS